MENKKMGKVTQVFCSTMRMDLWISEILISFSLLESETLGVMESGTESLQMKMRLGTIIKV